MLNKRALLLIIISIITIILLNTCGIEDTTLFFQEPRNFHILDQGNYIFSFYGFNQEKDADRFVFAGYDIWYYFTSSKNAKKANVRYPFVNNPDTIHDSPHSKLLDVISDSNDPGRFPADQFSISDIYRYITFPVNSDMISNILKKGKNDNVRFSLINLAEPSPSDFNPKKVNDYIIMEELYPNYDEYGTFTGTRSVGGKFLRFFR